ncbi:MAG TPA: DEAD/DEAH box helicase family protein [Candidatus Nanoarchaeia archaeon]|nr:DEAD/DEAH box helicase family protein [Candidatus Nanoarchaeia archaeon]
MNLRIQHNYTYFSINKEENPYEMYNYVQQACKFEYSAFHRGNGEIIHQDKSLCLANLNLRKFPTGLFNKVVEEVPESIELNIIDERNYKDIIEEQHAKFDYDFYDKQKLAIDIGIENRRGYYHIATGGGKTTIIATLLGHFKGKALVIVPSIDLVEQIGFDIFNALNEDIDFIIGKESIYASQSRIKVASVDTLDSSFDELVSNGWLEQFNTIMLDEAHHANFTKAKIIKKGGRIIRRIPQGYTGYYKIAMACPAENRFGFSATPEESELFIQAVCGKKLIQIDEDYLISIGRLAKPYILIYKHKVPFYEDEKEATKNNIYLNENRNYMLLKAIQTINQHDGTSLLMIDSKKFQLDLLRQISDEIIEVTGDTKLKERKRIYTQLENKEINNIVLTVGKEGLNIPSVDAIVRGSAKKSERLVVQEKGRGARVTKTKGKVLLIDTYDDDGVNKIQKEEYKWITKVGHLRKHSEERLDIYKKTKASIIKIVETEEDFIDYINKFFNGEL